ncbi:hypothetical protein ACFLU3_00340, partial [Chloroflexota bacterium]
HFEHAVYWKCADTGECMLKLDGEDEDDYGCLGQHTYNAEFWDNVTEWKHLGGIYIRDRADLLNTICEDVETETGMQVVSDDGTRGILRGYFYEIYLNVFSLDDNDIATIDSGRFQVVSKLPGIWLVAVLTDGHATGLAWVYPEEFDQVVAVFQKVLQKHRASRQVQTIKQLKNSIDRLESDMVQSLDKITWEMLAETRCDGCPHD